MNEQAVKKQEKIIADRFEETGPIKAPLLEKILSHDLKKVGILGGAGVDPDGLASSTLMSAIIKNQNPDAVVIVYYRGTFDRPQNRTMRQSLALDVKSENDEVYGFNAQNTEAEPFTCIISVDGPASVCPAVPHFIIDHHEQSGETPIIGDDVRKIGSASAIVWEYAIEAGIDFSTEDGAKLATALAIGIMTDTNNFGTQNSSSLDTEAYAFALEHKDSKLFNEIKNYPKPAYYIDMLSKGWDKRRQSGTVLVTGVGVIPRQRSGVISDLAEKYAELDGVNTAVVGAIIKDESVIEISVRSSNNALNVDEFVRAAFGSGGGKRGAGRANIILPPIFKGLTEEHADQLWELTRTIIIDKALQAAGDGERPAAQE
jgi:nanoRNase/pAp phosphatase (c-di-AMP/oligoRNAs hydrolase)